ncbi:MAG: substrate-binding domain-containing protein [Ruminococcus sp.]|nr:substrate-binding domain-containing protein [Ruminococcus sp.]
MKKRILIGVIITDCFIDFQEEILRGIISQSFRSECDVAVIAPLHNFFNGSVHKDTEKYIFDLILSDKFDGFLYDRNTFYGEEIRSHIDDLLMLSGKPVMLMDSREHKSFETTSVDDCEAFEVITDHLIDVHGYKNIYCLTGPKKVYISEERLKGYVNSMKKHGLTIDKYSCHYGDFWIDAAKEMAAKIIDGRLPKPEAVVCGNDITAITLSHALIAGGIRVPEDIAVTGYDASSDAENAEPSITTYSRPNFQLGAEACRRLYRIITGRICPKVPNENGALRLGRSCGCEAKPVVHRELKRQKQVNSEFESQLLYGDMLFDITNTDNVPVFSDRLDNYTYMLYKMSHLRICLTEKYIGATKGSYHDKLTFHCGDDVRVVLAKSTAHREYHMADTYSSSEIIPDLCGDKPYPSAYYVSPLHYNDNFFGYSAISFGKEPISFSSLYLKWINYVNVALELVRTKAIMSHTILKTNRALHYDKVTGMLNRNGVEQEFAKRAAVGFNMDSVDFITVELTGIKSTYYRSGEEKCNQISSAFAGILKTCVADKEICGMWNNQTMCVITFRENRAQEIYESLCQKIKESSFNSENSCNVDFSVGTFTQPVGDKIDISEAMYKSTVNKVYTYNTSELIENPQFEKLCALRNKIMKNPEKPWKISEIADSLYLSKSYLQKIYKTFFNKSIIEEMIEFRINNAKELLINTEMTVTDISRKCGYSSYNYFVRQFRSIEGASPSEYRENYRRESLSEE